MITADGRQIISGHHSTEEERKASLTPQKWKIWKKIEKEIASRDTGTINIVLTNNQNRIAGKEGARNPWGHREGSIGNTIDYCIKAGCFTKEEIAKLSGSKINKVRSHIEHLKRDKGVDVKIVNDIVFFNNTNDDNPRLSNKASTLDNDNHINDLYEGTVKKIQLTSYERNATARKKCIEYYGDSCIICGFNFGQFYGPEAAGFIIVHHVVPLSKINRKYKIDPISDLVPVCPNCHAFIHLGGKTKDINDIQKLLKNKNTKT